MKYVICVLSLIFANTTFADITTTDKQKQYCDVISDVTASLVKARQVGYPKDQAYQNLISSFDNRTPEEIKVYENLIDLAYGMPVGSSDEEKKEFIQMAKESIHKSCMSRKFK